jgi:hypothetical protein
MNHGEFRQIRNRILLWTSLPILCWLMMQAVHEVGHVVGALVSGGTVVDVDLHPLRVSHTFVHPNPMPVVVVWSGPIFGALLPIWLWLLVRISWQSKAYLFRFFAGFCLVANGMYLGSVGIEGVGDARDLIQLGVPLWTLFVFAAFTVPAGFILWNGQGENFGIGSRAQQIPNQEAVGVAVFTLLFVASGWILFR